MSTADHVAWTGHVGAFLHVEVDDTGNIQIAVRALNSRLDNRISPDGYVRSDVSNAKLLAETLESAQRFVQAVFPAGKQDYTWQQRAEAYAALGVSGKLGSQPHLLAREVGLFLLDYTLAERAATDGGKRPHMTMEAYAVGEYESWR